MGRVLGRGKRDMTSTRVEQNSRNTGNIQGAVVVKISQSGCDTEAKRMLRGRESAVTITEKKSIIVVVTTQHQVEGTVPVNVACLQTAHIRYALARYWLSECSVAVV